MWITTTVTQNEHSSPYSTLLEHGSTYGSVGADFEVNPICGIYLIAFEISARNSFSSKRNTLIDLAS